MFVLPYLVVCVSTTLASLGLRPSGWLDRLVAYHKDQFLTDVGKVANIKIKATVELPPPGYVDSPAWDFDSVYRLLTLIRQSKRAAPVKRVLRRMYDSDDQADSDDSDGGVVELGGLKSGEQFYKSTRPRLLLLLTRDHRVRFSDSSVVVIDNPVEARLPSSMISIRLLREIMQARGVAARKMLTAMRLRTTPSTP